MKVKILKECRLSPHGHDVLICQKDDIIEGKGAECALRSGLGEEIKPKVTKPKKAPEVEGQKPKAKKPTKPKVKK